MPICQVPLCAEKNVECISQVVFSALAVLAIAVIIISKVIGTLFKESAPKAAAAVAAPAPAIDEESYAVLLAAVSEEARLSGEEFRVVSIKEL